MTDKPTQTVDAPYDPDEADGEIGWLWLADEGEWRLAYTWLPDGIDAEPMVRMLKHPDDPTDGEVYPAEDWIGTPYISCAPPAVDPGDVGLVVIHAPGGLRISLAVNGDGAAEKMQETVDAVMRAVRGDDTSGGRG